LGITALSLLGVHIERGVCDLDVGLKLPGGVEIPWVELFVH